MALLPDSVISVSKAELEPYSDGKRVGSYLIGRTIGEGSFAKVKEAIHVSTGEKVAIKIINKRKVREDRYVSRNLKREAEIMQKLRHPNIVRLLEVMETDSFYYLVTELCTGGELLDLICERKYLNEATAKRYVQQLLSAVEAMHHRGVVHRDLKIENFLLDDQDNLKIVDFGLSNIIHSAAMEAWKRLGMCPLLLTTHCGSPAYAAPELLAQKPYGAQVDVWSIGVNMFAMLTGNLPYNLERFNIIDMYKRMMERRMVPFPKYVTKEARDLIMQLLDPVPETRISLEKATNHSWLKSSSNSYMPGGNTFARMSIEVNQDIALHMADKMGMSMKEIVNSVTQNRASHSFAIYFLLNERLKRFGKQKRVKDCGSLNSDRKFAKVKVIRKATLQQDFNPKNKFMYKGVKITKGTHSQSCIQGKEGDNNTSDGDSEPETLKLYQPRGHWHQYATFPRDRRNSNSVTSKSNEPRLGSATLDKGSDDIDYHHISSPETTDHSASSIESSIALRTKLMNMESIDLGMPSLQRAKESVSDEDCFTRGRSKSLTGREEYDYQHSAPNQSVRQRASTTASSFHQLELYADKNATLEISKGKPSTFRMINPNKRNVRVLETEFKDFVIIESHEVCMENNYSEKLNMDEESLANTRCSQDTNDKNLRNLESSSQSRYSKGIKGPRKKQFVKMDQANDENIKSITGSEVYNEKWTEIIPPPTPFKDRDLQVNIELVESQKILIAENHRKPSTKLEHKVISGAKRRKDLQKNGQKRFDTRESAMKSKKTEQEKPVKKIELEKVRKVALETFPSPSVQLPPVSQVPLHKVKQELALDASTVIGHLSDASQLVMDPNNNNYNTKSSPSNLKSLEKPTEFNPFKVNVVKLAKCHCIPVLRPEVVEPRQLMIGRRYSQSEPRTSSQRYAEALSESRSVSSAMRFTSDYEKNDPIEKEHEIMIKTKSKDIQSTFSKENENLFSLRPQLTTNLTETENIQSRRLTETDIYDKMEQRGAQYKSDKFS